MNDMLTHHAPHGIRRVNGDTADVGNQLLWDGNQPLRGGATSLTCVGAAGLAAFAAGGLSLYLLAHWLAT